MSNVLYVTSFNKELYEASGKNLLDSFEKHKIQGHMCIGYEQLRIPEDLSLNQALYIPLDNDVIIKKVFDDNIDVIPEYLGGKQKVCKCKKPWGKRDDSHVQGCPFTWWNRNFIRWFRKVVTCYHAQKFIQSNNLPFDYLVWVDSDCVFLQTMTSHNIVKLLQNYDVAYMKGRRKVIESGILGFNLNWRGKEIINAWLDAYISGTFRRFNRWDDGFIFNHLVYNMGMSWRKLDLIPESSRNTNDVDKDSKLKNYIRHSKGLHGRILGLMK